MKGPRANLTTPQAVLRTHGGELTFWLAWLSDELGPDLRDWFRRQARQDLVLQKDLESIDQPAAREQLHNALEATNYLTPRDGTEEAPVGAEPLTGFALQDDAAAPPSPTEAARGTVPAADGDWRLAYSGRERHVPRDEGRRELRRRVGHSLFQLLAEVEVPLPAEEEAREATQLLHHLAGVPAVDRFRQLDRWLHEARRRAAGLAVLDRVLHWLTPELFQTDGAGFRHHLSFRLYLRARLKDYCKQRSWQPAGPRYHDLNAAFSQLQRDRIGQIVYQAIEETTDQGLEEARVSPRQVLQWLQVAP